MIDLHSHILPGVDDGSATLDDAIALARAAAADGITAIAATPHVRDDYPTSLAEMRAGVEALRGALAAAGVELELHTGGEIALNRLDALTTEELAGFGLAGSRYVLLEFPYHGWPLELPTRVFELQAAGLVPVLAHPERSAEVTAAPDRLRALVSGGALVQVTAASLDGRLGRRAQRSALALVREGLAHLIASDAHAPAVRGVGMSAAADALGDAALARALTVDAPAAIVANADVVPRAETAAARRRWWRLGRGG